MTAPLAAWSTRLPGEASAPRRGELRAGDRPLGGFRIDRYEVTNRQYRAFVNAGGYSRREYWTEPLVRSHSAWALGRLGSSAAVVAVRERLEVEDDPDVRDELLAALSLW